MSVVVVPLWLVVVGADRDTLLVGADIQPAAGAEERPILLVVVGNILPEAELGVRLGVVAGIGIFGVAAEPLHRLVVVEQHILEVEVYTYISEQV
ncbi:MAG: hypothetical protein QXI59_02725 [Candidatus Bathyarchaeia archaeon]|nr:hypothetical protein [Candidatus Bathyarchaeota archaeon]